MSSTWERRWYKLYKFGWSHLKVSLLCAYVRNGSGGRRQLMDRTRWHSNSAYSRGRDIQRGRRLTQGYLILMIIQLFLRKEKTKVTRTANRWGFQGNISKVITFVRILLCLSSDGVSGVSGIWPLMTPVWAKTQKQNKTQQIYLTAFVKSPWINLSFLSQGKPTGCHFFQFHWLISHSFHFLKMKRMRDIVPTMCQAL